jgi:hypothetical protein
MAENEKPLEKMTAKELREVALAEGGIVGVHGMNKAELIAAIKESRGIEDEGGKKVDAGAIRALKKEMLELKAERDKFREEGDDLKVQALRRRLSKMKKKTRRLAKAG